MRRNKDQSQFPLIYNNILHSFVVFSSALVLADMRGRKKILRRTKNKFVYKYHNGSAVNGY
jgi:hypothetical protein